MSTETEPRSGRRSWRTIRWISASIAMGGCGGGVVVPADVDEYLRARVDGGSPTVVCALPDEQAAQFRGSSWYTSWDAGSVNLPVVVSAGRIIGARTSEAGDASVFLRDHGTITVGWGASSARTSSCEWIRFDPGFAVRGVVEGVWSGTRSTVVSTCGEFTTVESDGGFRLMLAADRPCEVAVVSFDPATHRYAKGPPVHVNGSGEPSEQVSLRAPSNAAMQPVEFDEESMARDAALLEGVFGVSPPNLLEHATGAN